MARASLRHALDRDVYQVVKKLEDANGGKPFKSVYAAYDAIKKSNSSLSRQKKRPLEDALDRVLQVRIQELAESEDSDDSEAALEQATLEQAKPEDERFLLNRQMTKHWNVESANQSSAEQLQQPAKKKRRVQDDEDGRNGTHEDGHTVHIDSTQKEARLRDKLDKSDKSMQKKQQRSTRFEVESEIQAPLLGGLDKEYSELYKQSAYILRRPEDYEALFYRRAPAILLAGPPGVGKQSLIRALAADLAVPIVSLAGCFEDPERIEKSLSDAVDTALALAPCIIFIEDLESHMGKPGGSSHNDHHQKARSHFKRQMLRLQQHRGDNGPVLALATTARITDVDPGALHLGLFERTIQIRIPDDAARRDILRVLTQKLNMAADVNLEDLSKLMHGFVGADIVNVLTLAQQVSIVRIMAVAGMDISQRGLPRPDLAPSALAVSLFETAATPPPYKEGELRADDFKQVIKKFTPSLRKEGFTVIPNVTWDQVGALTKIREQLHMSIIGPIRDPELYQSFGLQRPAGALLWGPPGCGKTLVAQAVANEAQASFILINGPELLNKYLGESERAVRELFQRARSSTPCILFFDEIDSLVPKRDNASTEAGARIVNALLTELDGAQDRSGIYVIGTTNRPDMIDSAMLRPGRLSIRLFVDLPTPEERVDILRAIYQTCHAETSLNELARLPVVALDTRCSDFSGANLGGLHTKAAECALRRWQLGEKSVREIDEMDWEAALDSTQRSVSNPKQYRMLNASYSQTQTR